MHDKNLEVLVVVVVLSCIVESFRLEKRYWLIIDHIWAVIGVVASYMYQQSDTIDDHAISLLIWQCDIDVHRHSVDCFCHCNALFFHHIQTFCHCIDDNENGIDDKMHDTTMTMK
jgi:hypothetical protein